MLTCCSTISSDDIKKETASNNPNNSDPSEISTGESQYKEEINEVKCAKNKYNKINIKNNGGESKLLNRKVKRFNFLSPNKKQKNNNNNANNKNNMISNIFQEFKSSISQYSKYPQFKIIEKNIRNDFYSSPHELLRDIRQIFSNLFLSALTPLDSEKYEKLLILSQIFEQNLQKYEKNSQIKTAQKLSDDLAKLKKELNKLTRKKNIKIGDLGHAQNLEEKKENSMDNIRESISYKITKLNNEQKKGILNILGEDFINKNNRNNIIEFNISNLPINQLKKLDKYINKCINNNININNYKKEIEEKQNDLIQMDELSSSSSELSDSLDSESADLE